MGRRGQPKGTTIPPPGWLVKGAKLIETMWTIVSDPFRFDAGDSCKRWAVHIQCECGTMRVITLGQLRSPQRFPSMCRRCYLKLTSGEKRELGMDATRRESFRCAHIAQTAQKGRWRRYKRTFSTTRQRLGPCWPDPKVMMPDGTIWKGADDE